MVGKKIAPIWKDADGPMMESLDIIGKMDPEGTIKPSSGRDDFKKWQKEVQTLMRKLCRPRYVKVPLPEFMQKAGRDAFVNNHQMPPFEKTDWKGNAGERNRPPPSPARARPLPRSVARRAGPQTCRSRSSTGTTTRPTARAPA